jgi:hypothetical protein
LAEEEDEEDMMMMLNGGYGYGEMILLFSLMKDRFVATKSLVCVYSLESVVCLSGNAISLSCTGTGSLADGTKEGAASLENVAEG